MALTLHTIKPKKGSKKPKKRIGRGLGSGKGRTAGRGQKGQKSRSGASGFQRLGIRKEMLATPKLRGFTSSKKKPAAVNLAAISKHFGKGETVTVKTLTKKGLIRPADKEVKILGSGDVSEALTFKGVAVSKSAAGKIMNAGGTIEA